MALTTTSLAATFPLTSLSFNATSATGATVNGFARVDGEFMRIATVDGARIGVYSRGDFGGVAIAHDILAPVTFGLLSDLSVVPMQELIPIPPDLNIVSIGQNTATLPAITRNTQYVITKGSALGTTTLPAPLKSNDGHEVTITSLTDFAHVVTTSVFNGVTGGAKTTLTAPAFKGCTITMVAFGGSWYLKSNAAWVIS